MSLTGPLKHIKTTFMLRDTKRPDISYGPYDSPAAARKRARRFNELRVGTALAGAPWELITIKTYASSLQP